MLVAAMPPQNPIRWAVSFQFFIERLKCPPQQLAQGASVVPLKCRKIPQVRSTHFRSFVYGAVAQVKRIYILDVAASLADAAQNVFCEGIMWIWVVVGVWHEQLNRDFHYL